MFVILHLRPDTFACNIKSDHNCDFPMNCNSLQSSRTRSGGKHRHSPINKLVQRAIQNVKKRAKEERVANEQCRREANQVKREFNLARALEGKYTQQKRADAKVMETHLASGQCTVRIKLGTLQITRSNELSSKRKRAYMRMTCWMWCYDCSQWRNPQLGWTRTGPGGVHSTMCPFVGTVPKTPSIAWDVWKSCQRTRSPCSDPIVTYAKPLVYSPPDDNSPQPHDDDPYVGWLINPWQNYLKRREDVRLVGPLINSIEAHWTIS